MYIAVVQTWNDYRIRWNVTEYGGLTEIAVKSSKLWIPELLLTNK